jgi:hypothetical protein
MWTTGTWPEVFFTPPFHHRESLNVKNNVCCAIKDASAEPVCLACGLVLSSQPHWCSLVFQEDTMPTGLVLTPPVCVRTLNSLQHGTVCKMAGGENRQVHALTQALLRTREEPRFTMTNVSRSFCSGVHCCLKERRHQLLCTVSKAGESWGPTP